MATIERSLSPLPMNTMGCCERFTLFLEHIKNLAYRFFRCLFCCQQTPVKPLPPVSQVKKNAISKVIEPLFSHSSSSSSSSAASSVSATVLPAPNPLVPPVAIAHEPRAFITQFISCFSNQLEEDEQPASFASDTLFIEIIKGLARQEDQLFMLQKIIQTNTDKRCIDDLQMMTNELPPELRKLIESKLEQVVDGIEEYRSSVVIHGRQNLSSRVWSINKLDPVLQELIERTQLEPPIIPHKEFLQRCLFYICSSASSAQPSGTTFTTENLKNFASFKQHEQAEILLSLSSLTFKIELNKLPKPLNVYELLNAFWKELRPLISDPETPDDIKSANLLKCIRLLEQLTQEMQTK